MAATYTQLYIQIIFAVRKRNTLIENVWKDDLHKYMAGIVKGMEQKPIIINGMPNHIHAFVGVRPSMRISDLVRDLKNNSSKYINERKLVKEKFHWQDGYGAFSYSHSHVKQVYNYILNQEQHHKKITFKQEYLSFLEKFDIQFDERYLFEFF